MEDCEGACHGVSAVLLIAAQCDLRPWTLQMPSYCAGSHWECLRQLDVKLNCKQIFFVGGFSLGRRAPADSNNGITGFSGIQLQAQKGPSIREAVTHSETVNVQAMREPGETMDTWGGSSSMLRATLQGPHTILVAWSSINYAFRRV